MAITSVEEALGIFLEEISLRTLDSVVIDVIRDERKLAECRTLDSIHLATALLFRRASPEPFSFYTLDEKMAEAARKLGFQVAL